MFASRRLYLAIAALLGALGLAGVWWVGWGLLGAANSGQEPAEKAVLTALPPEPELAGSAAARTAAWASTSSVLVVRGKARSAAGRKVSVRPGSLVHSVATKRRLIALTFDDGPSGNLELILEHLAAAEARATFFCVGERSLAHDDKLQLLVAQGHELGNHTYEHLDLDAAATDDIVRSLARTQARFAQAGVPRPVFMRPPMGRFDSRLAGIAARQRLAVALWSVRSGDANGETADGVASAVLGSARPGAVVLMHETAPATVKALPKILKRLADKGYEMVTVSDLVAAGGSR